MHKALADRENRTLHLHARLNVLRGLRVQIHLVEIAETEGGLARAHVLPHELGNLLQSIADFYAFRAQEVEEVRVRDVLWPLRREGFRLRVAVEFIKLLLQDVQLVLPRHDIFALLGFLLSLSWHRREVVVDHVEDAGALPRCRWQHLLLHCSIFLWVGRLDRRRQRIFERLRCRRWSG